MVADPVRARGGMRSMAPISVVGSPQGTLPDEQVLEREARCWNRPVRVGFQSGVIHGILQTLYPRVSDHLLEAEDRLELRDATVLPARATEPLARQAHVLLNKRALLFVIDLSPEPDTPANVYVPREVYDVTISIGSYWIRGHAHVPPGVEMRYYLNGASTHFIPITNATTVGAPDPPRTFLVNREHVSATIVHGVIED